MRRLLFRSVRHGSAACVLAAALSGCGSGAAALPVERVPVGGSLSAACDAALQRTEAVPQRTAAMRWTPALRVGDEEAHPLGRIVGAAWDAEAGRLYVVDGLNSRVSVYDTAGRWISSFGRAGGGPGEFSELGSGHGSRPVYNQLARTGAGMLVVNDLDLLHLFSPDGRFLARAATPGAEAGPYGVRHVAAWTDGSVLVAESGAMGMDEPAARRADRLLVVTPRGESLDTATLARVDNPVSLLPPFEGVPPTSPYMGYYRRTWDAVPGTIAVAALREPGVCFFGAGNRLLGAARVRAPLIRTTRAERARVLRAVRARSAAPPMVGGRWEDYYRVWPETAPTYLDVALAPDGTLWAERLLPDGGTTVDFYHARHGYLGSMPPMAPRLPLAFTPRCALTVHEETAEDESGRDFYGLRGWCPAGPATPPSRREP